MGVPALFSNVVRTHPAVIKTLEGVSVCGGGRHIEKAKYDNLYLDSNSVVYDCVHRSHGKPVTDESIIGDVCKQIHSYISLVKPSKTVIIAFDGVAPVAKLENQRNRRYKSEFVASLMRHAGVAKTSWDTTAITPGTPFMEKLDAGLRSYFGGQSKSKFGAESVMLTTSMEAGEGEHKIFEFIRNNEDKHADEKTVIYGLDADLIMLSINHLDVCPNLFLFRETPHFIRSLNRNLDPGQLYTLDIGELFAGVCNTMYGKCKQEELPSPRDYVLLVSLLGNDYIPHNPAFNIRTGGLDVLMNSYKSAFVSGVKCHSGDLLTDGEFLNWDNLRVFVRALAAMEEGLLVTEHNRREAMSRKPFALRGNGKAIGLDDEITQRLDAIPTYNREKERYIDPTEDYWQERYYVALFGGRRNDVAPAVCRAYLEALEWTMRYYTVGCPDWRWSYPYAYAPLFCDLLEHMPTSGEMVKQAKPNPVSAMTQLSYVLPVTAQHMIPQRLRQELCDKMEGKYGSNWDFEWAYCRYFWECHANMPHIDVEQLERIVIGVR